MANANKNKQMLIMKFENMYKVHLPSLYTTKTLMNIMIGNTDPINKVPYLPVSSA